MGLTAEQLRVAIDALAAIEPGFAGGLSRVGYPAPRIPARMVVASDEVLRAVGFSRQKIGYARSLAGEIASGRLDLATLPADDEEAIAALCRIKGIGRWSAEIYLLFAEGRTDIWPAGDLAVQAEVGRLLDLGYRPGEAETRTLAERWRPHRGAAAVFAWHHYTLARAKPKDESAAPV